VAGQPEQVLALVGGEHQGTAQRGQHLPGRMRPPGLLQPDVVVHGDPGKPGDLLAAQSGRAPPVAAGQPHVGGAQALPAGAQERGKLAAVQHGAGLSV